MNYLRASQIFRNFTRKEKAVRIRLETPVRFNHAGLFYGDEVAQAKRRRSPIVALESASIVTHGLPYPGNLDAALEVEDTVRQNGATPAMTAVLNGKQKVGLTKEELEWLAKTKDANITKVSRRNLAYTISQGLSGGTTVSSTMQMAHLAGIAIVATGGIRCQHQLNMDISADLKELVETPVMVVCSDAKAIMDLPETFEYLETAGVPIVTVGDNIEFSVFYMRHLVHHPYIPFFELESAEEPCLMIDEHVKRGSNTGILFAAPVPANVCHDPLEIESAIVKATRRQKVRCDNVVPFVMNELNKFTVKVALRANKSLVKNNARVASEIAVRLAEVYKRSLADDDD